MYGEGNFERPCKYFDALKKQRILLTLLNMKLHLNVITVNVSTCNVSTLQLINVVRFRRSHLLSITVVDHTKIISY
jgi:hypothetical protein